FLSLPFDDLFLHCLPTRRSSDLLIERTEGNPLFLEESVRALVETADLVGEPGAYRLAQAAGTIQVPPTVQTILASRIDRLSAEQDRKSTRLNSVTVRSRMPSSA